MLSQKGGTDDSGIHYPTLREGRVLRPYERVWTETTFTYGLVGLPYRLEIALCRQLYGQGKSAAHTEFRMYAPAWDIAMGGTEGLMCDEWDHGVDLEALFPANDWDVQGTGRFGSFIAAVERVKSFLVEASKRAPNAEDTLELSEDRGFDGN